MYREGDDLKFKRDCEHDSVFFCRNRIAYVIEDECLETGTVLLGFAKALQAVRYTRSGVKYKEVDESLAPLDKVTGFHHVRRMPVDFIKANCKDRYKP